MEVPPDFGRLVHDSLAAILAFRWEKAQGCAKAGAYLFAIVMMGSLLEGLLLYKVEQNLMVANRAKCTPKTGLANPKRSTNGAYQC